MGIERPADDLAAEFARPCRGGLGVVDREGDAPVRRQCRIAGSDRALKSPSGITLAAGSLSSCSGASEWGAPAAARAAWAAAASPAGRSPGPPIWCDLAVTRTT